MDNEPLSTPTTWPRVFVLDGERVVQLNASVRYLPEVDSGGQGPMFSLLRVRNRQALGWVRYSLDSLAGITGATKARILLRVRDPKGCWPARALLLRPLYEIEYLALRDGVDGRSLAEWSRECGITVPAMVARLARWSERQAGGRSFSRTDLWTLRDVLTYRADTMMGKPPETVKKLREGKDQRTRPFEYQGCWGTLADHCKRLGLKEATVRSRMQGRKVYGPPGLGGSRELRASYPGMSAHDALATGHRKPRADKGVPRPHLHDGVTYVRSSRGGR